MLNISNIPARNLQKSYRSIINLVKTNKKPVILTTLDKPQAAIVSLEDLEKIQQTKTIQASLDLFKLAIESREELKDLPTDLRTKANQLLYTK